MEVSPELTELSELTNWAKVDTTPQRLKATLLRPAGGNVALAEAKAERTAGDLGNLLYGWERSGGNGNSQL